MNKLKIAILYASFGGGHKSSAFSIKDYLEEKGDVEVQVLDYLEYFNKLINRVSIGVYNNIGNLPESFYSGMYNSAGSNTHFSSFITNILKLTGIKLIKYFKNFTPDIVISTHPFATQAVAYLKKKNKFNFLLANILTDFEIHKLWYEPSENIDLFFVSSEDMKRDLVFKNVKKDKIFVTGIPVKKEFLKYYDRDLVYEYFKLNKENRTITFFVGGGQGIAFKGIFDYLKIALKIFSDYNIVVISGKNEKLKDKVEEIVKEYNKKNNIKVFSFIKDIPELMFISDFIISKPGGLTTSESLAINTPLIAISPIPGQEIANASYLESSGAGIFIKSLSEAESIFTKIKKNNTYEFMKTLKDNIKNISHPHATSEIIDIIFNKFYSENNK